MANQLKMAKLQSILTLYERGWSQRRIARELGIHRETVGRHVLLSQQEPPGPAEVPAGSARSQPAKVPAGSTGPPERSYSACEPLREEIPAKLDQGLSGQRLWQDLVGEHGFARAYDSVKRLIRRLGKATPLPSRRMAGAAEAQLPSSSRA